jgi:DNA-damage-inducible protein D
MHDLSKRAAGDKSGSPFDQIRHVDERGEYWQARELMPLMGYPRWQQFEPVIERAKQAAVNTGSDVSSHFRVNPKMVNRPQGGGRTQDDYRLTRYAAYLVAMNGDPRKPEVAAAQAYFAVRSVQAETIEADLAGLPDWARREINTIMRVGKIEEEQRRQDREIVRQAKELLEHQARLDAIEGRHDWFSALAYAKKNKLDTSLPATQALGRAAARICRQRGIEPGKSQHQLYGEVGTYPEDVLGDAANLITHRRLIARR